MPAACAARRTPAIGAIAGKDSGARGETSGIGTFSLSWDHRPIVVGLLSANELRQRDRGTKKPPISVGGGKSCCGSENRSAGVWPYRRRSVERANAPAPPVRRRRRRFRSMRGSAIMQQAYNGKRYLRKGATCTGVPFITRGSGLPGERV